MTILKIERLPHNEVLPEYKTEGAAGMDLCAAISEPVTLKPLERTLIPTGLKIELNLLKYNLYKSYEYQKYQEKNIIIKLYHVVSSLLLDRLYRYLLQLRTNQISIFFLILIKIISVYL